MLFFFLLLVFLILLQLLLSRAKSLVPSVFQYLSYGVIKVIMDTVKIQMYKRRTFAAEVSFLKIAVTPLFLPPFENEVLSLSTEISRVLHTRR